MKKVVVLGIILLIIILVGCGGGGGAATYEACAEELLEAIDAEDMDTMWNLTSTDNQESIGREDFENITDDLFDLDTEEMMVIQCEEFEEGLACVIVGFPALGPEDHIAWALVEEDDGWKIDWSQSMEFTEIWQEEDW